MCPTRIKQSLSLVFFFGVSDGIWFQVWSRSSVLGLVYGVMKQSKIPFFKKRESVMMEQECANNDAKIIKKRTLPLWLEGESSNGGVTICFIPFFNLSLPLNDELCFSET